MKKLFSILIMLVLVISIFTACGGKNSTDDKKPEGSTTDESSTEGDSEGGTAAALKDGTYKAEEPDFDPNSGWKDNVTLEVKEGKIASVDWNSTHKENEKDKKTVSKSGEYGMVEKGNASSEWHEQAEKVESYLIEKQDPDAISVKEDGTTDSIAGVTIHVGGFVDVVKEALSKAK